MFQQILDRMPGTLNSMNKRSRKLLCQSEKDFAAGKASMNKNSAKKKVLTRFRLVLQRSGRPQIQLKQQDGQSTLHTTHTLLGLTSRRTAMTLTLKRR